MEQVPCHELERTLGEARCQSRSEALEDRPRIRCEPRFEAGPTDASRAIDELAHVLATDRLSIAAKVALLEQWRYDVLLRDVGANEGLGSAATDTMLLQQLTKVLLVLAEH